MEEGDPLTTPPKEEKKEEKLPVHHNRNNNPEAVKLQVHRVAREGGRNWERSIQESKKKTENKTGTEVAFFTILHILETHLLLLRSTNIHWALPERKKKKNTLVFSGEGGGEERRGGLRGGQTDCVGKVNSLNKMHLCQNGGVKRPLLISKFHGETAGRGEN